jgi:hypothetical protein
MRNVSERKSKYKFYVQIFSINHALYEILWENMLEPDRPQMVTDAEKIWFA